MAVVLVSAAILVIVAVWVTMTPVFGSSGRPSTEIPVEVARLRDHVHALAGAPGARSYDNPEALEQAAAYIEDELAKAGARVRRQTYRVQGQPHHNIVATYGEHSGRRLIIGAHYDVCGHQPGADDNASGVAGLLEVARLLQTQAPELDYEIELVAYALEEPPFFRTPDMGSAVHARSLSQSKAAIIGMIGLEMIGYFTDALGSQNYPSPLLYLMYPTQGNFIAVVGRIGQGDWVRAVKKTMIAGGQVPVRAITAPPFLPGVDLSDHVNYWSEGFRAVMVTDTAFFRNANYHEVTDTPDTLDYERMAEVVKQVYWTAVNQGRLIQQK